ncbi:MAG: ABC transporter permease [Acidimicrobiales bacterium]
MSSPAATGTSGASPTGVPAAAAGAAGAASDADAADAATGSADPADPDIAVEAGGAGTRGHRQGALLRLRGDIPVGLRRAAIGAGVASTLLLWVLASTVFASDGFAVPTIAETWRALVEMYRADELLPDLAASTQRVGIGYSVSIVIGVLLGVLIGSFATFEAYFEPQIGFLRYIPATALTPLFLIWLGIDEAPKVALIIVGTVFFNTLMVADVARSVPIELVKASYTLGARRLTVLRRVILPHSWPGIVDVARINLAAAWLMLVVAELLAAQDGLAFRIVRAQRFRAIDRMFALLLIFGLIGLASDLALRWLRRRTARWAVD